jgi:hypothetical protein
VALGVTRRREDSHTRRDLVLSAHDLDAVLERHEMSARRVREQGGHRRQPGRVRPPGPFVGPDEVSGGGKGGFSSRGVAADVVGVGMRYHDDVDVLAPNPRGLEVVEGVPGGRRQITDADVHQDRPSGRLDRQRGVRRWNGVRLVTVRRKRDRDLLLGRVRDVALGVIGHVAVVHGEAADRTDPKLDGIHRVDSTIRVGR